MNIAFFADINDNHNQKWLNILAKKHKIIVFTELNNSLKIKAEFETDNIIIYSILPTSYSVKNVFIKHKIIKTINQLLLKHNIDFVHSIYAIPYSLWAGDVASKGHIITTYGSDILISYASFLKTPKNLRYRISYFLLKKRLTQIFNNSNCITSTSSEQLKVIKQNVYSHKKLMVIRTGVDCHSFINKYNQLFQESNDFIILSNRAMRSLYNIDIIVDAFYDCFTKWNVPQKLKLVLLNYNTEEPFFQSVLEKIKNYKIEQSVILYTELVGDKLIQQYKNASVVIMIPKSDGTPVTGVETLLSKKPLIIGSLNYDEDLFNDNTVWKLKNNSRDDLSQKIFEIMSASRTDIENKLKTGFDAALLGGNLTVEIEKIEQEYQDIIKSH